MGSITSTGRVIAKAKELVETAPDGIRCSDLQRQISAAFPDIPPNTVHGALHKFRNDLPDGLLLARKGLYEHVRFRAEEELEECTKAISLGVNTFRDKWGTPTAPTS